MTFRWIVLSAKRHVKGLREAQPGVETAHAGKSAQLLVHQRLEPLASGDSLDWKDLSAEEITKRVTSKVQPGSIVLFHNAALHTPEALPSIIETLLQDGYTFVPISELIVDGAYGEDYTIDHTGRQCPTD